MMAPQTVISDTARRRLVELRQDGWSLQAIANALGTSTSVVHKVVRRLVSTGDLHQPPHTIGLDGKRYAPSREQEA
jgi:transposase